MRAAAAEAIVRAASSRQNGRYASSTTTSRFLAASTFKDQNKYATAMQEILLHDTPVVVPYFYYFLAAGSKSVKNYYANPQAQVYLSKTSLT